MNIVIYAHDLSLYGGLERVSVELANAMALRGHAVFLFFCEMPKGKPVYAIEKSVTLIYANYSGDRRQLQNFKKQILQCSPDVVISPSSWWDQWLWCVALYGTGIPWIYSEHSSPERIEKENWNKEERRAVLHGADAIHMLLDDSRASVPSRLRDRVHIIPNAVPLPEPLRPQANRGRLLLAVGRLEPVKQFHLLIQAMARLAPDFPDWQLEIWGEGSEKERLEREIQALGMQTQIRLCGLARQPHEQYARADLFCIPSRYEGFPLVIMEAMGHGLPVVGFKGCPGTNALIAHEEDGLLASEMSAESLSKALRVLMASSEARERMGSAARGSAQAFAPGPIYDAWEDLLSRTAALKGKTRLQSLDILEEWPPETREEMALLLERINRKFIFLPDSAWFKLFFMRRPRLKRLLMPLRRLQKRFFTFGIKHR